MMKNKIIDLLALYVPFWLLYQFLPKLPLHYVLLKMITKKKYKRFKRVIFLLEAKKNEPAIFLCNAYHRVGGEDNDELITGACNLFIHIKYKAEQQQDNKRIDGDNVSDTILTYSKVAGFLGCARFASILRLIALIELLDRKEILEEGKFEIALVEILSHREIIDHVASVIGDSLPVDYFFKKSKELLAEKKSEESLISSFSYSPNYDENESIKHLKSLFKNKKAFIAGPSVRHSDVYPSKSDNILVFALGFAGKKSMPESWADLDINGSFYAKHKFSRMKKDGSIKELSNIDYIFIKRDYEDLSIIRKFAKTDHIIQSPIYFRAIGTSLNAGTELLLVLEYFGFEKIELANIDLFLNDKYPSGYITTRKERYIERSEKEWKLSHGEMLRSFALYHSPAFQYSVYEYFYNKNLFLCDAFLSEIMEGGLYNYLTRLENQYGAN